MTEFFGINVDKFAGAGQKQLQVFGAAVDKKIQIAWAPPAVKSVTMLERVQHLITPMLRAHFDDIIAGAGDFEATVGMWPTLRGQLGLASGCAMPNKWERQWKTSYLL